MKKYAVILAGGVGERFWPLSRKDAPKYLWNVAGGGKSLLSMTFERVSKLLPAKNILVIAGGAQIKNIRKVCPEIPASQLVGEPIARDTTAAIGLAAVLVGKMAKGEDASFAVLPSDHMISDTGGFVKTMRSAFGVAEGGDRLVTIGIAPAYPATGFGYIRRGREYGTPSDAYYKAARFCEKPDLKKAQKFLADGGYFWNAGIFVWKVSSVLGAIEKNIPQTYGALTRMKGEIESGAKTAQAAAKYYPEIEKISIDFSVMERAKNAYVVPQNFDWTMWARGTLSSGIFPKMKTETLRAASFTLPTRAAASCSTPPEGARRCSALTTTSSCIQATPLWFARKNTRKSSRIW